MGGTVGRVVVGFAPSEGWVGVTLPGGELIGVSVGVSVGGWVGILVGGETGLVVGCSLVGG